MTAVILLEGLAHFCEPPPFHPWKETVRPPPPGLDGSWGMASGVTLVVVEVVAVTAAFLDVFKAPLVDATNAAATDAVRH